MNTKLKQLITCMVLVYAMTILSPVSQMVSWAANTRIAFSDPSVMVGNEVTVTMKITSDTPLGNAEVMLAYDPAALEFVSGTGANGGAGAIKVLGNMESADQKTFSFSLKFKALQAGDTKITVTSQEIYDADSQVINLDKQGTSSVKVTSPATSSKDATLKSLKISPGTLTPEFSPSTESYTAGVDGNTANLVVNAVAANAGAKVNLQGADGLQIGENNVVIKVTAEDGQTVKNYSILVTKSEGGEVSVPAEGGETQTAELGDIKVTIDDKEYSVAASFDVTSLPEGFEESTYDYKGSKVMSGKGTEKDLLLLYLQDADGNGGFYIYADEADTWTQFVQLEVTEKAIVVISPDTDTVIPNGLEQRQIEIDGKRVNGWVEKTEADPEYCILYGMNWDGEKNFYRYDLKEGTIQRYFASGVSKEEYAKTATDYNNLLKDYNLQFYILIGVGVLALILLVIVIILLKRAGGSGPDDWDRKRRGELEEVEFEPEQDYDTVEQTGRVKRYSREDFENGDVAGEVENFNRPVRNKRVAVPEEDDFDMEISLEDMEDQLRTNLAKESTVQRTLRPGTESGNQPQEKQLSQEDEDDFEFIDLDDER